VTILDAEGGTKKKEGRREGPRDRMAFRGKKHNT